MRDGGLEDVAGLVGPLGDEAAALAGAQIDRPSLPVASGNWNGVRGDAGLVDDGAPFRPVRDRAHRAERLVGRAAGAGLPIAAIAGRRNSP